jgi:putative transposase
MPTARNPLYRRHRFPPEVISHAVWLYFRFPLSLRLVEEMLAERGICVSYETVRQWAMKFGEASIAGEPYWLWRAVDQNGFVLDVLVQHREETAVRRAGS